MTVQIHDEGAIRHLTLDRPERLNAVDAATLDRLSAAMVDAGRDPEVRVVVLSGNGQAFCSGGDLNVPDPLALDNTERTADAATRCISAITDSSRPVIAAVNGPAVGAGVALALAADITVMREDAFLSLPFTSIGLMPDSGSTALVAAAAGRATALRMALLGERVTAAQAFTAGLVTTVSTRDDFDADVAALAQRLAALPQKAVELTKSAVNTATIGDLPLTLARERAGQLELTVSEGFRNAIASLSARSR